MKSRKDRADDLIERDAWFGVSYEGARIQNLRDAQTVSLQSKLAWLDQARDFAHRTSQKLRQQAEINAA